MKAQYLSFRKLTWAIIAMAASGCSAVRPASSKEGSLQNRDERYDTLKSFISSEMQNANAVGLAVAILEDGKVIHAEVFEV